MKMTWYRKIWLISVLLLLHLDSQGQIALGLNAMDPDQPKEALERLMLRRQSVAVKAVGPLELAEEMIQLGMWADAREVLDGMVGSSDQAILIRARLALMEHRFDKVESLVQAAPEGLEKSRLAIDLDLQAWDLGAAQAKIDSLKQGPAWTEMTPMDQAEVLFREGRLAIYQKDYQAAFNMGQKILTLTPDWAQGYYLQGESLLWLRELSAAEAALRKCLAMDPYHADARFSYGYALWRRVDATLLPVMADHWEVAIAANPLHYRTHWHWGNGHTHLTYQDYVDPQEDSIRQSLAMAESWLSQGEFDQALAEVRAVKAEFPGSVIPDLYLGSFYYLMPSPSDLDSAEAVFQRILAQKAHFGPAHNGLAAVIKKRQFPALRNYDSLQQVVEQTKIADPGSFFQVFDDLSKYPGDRVAKMVWQQLYSGVAYLPFLHKLGRKFVIPPLHQDLALAMGNSYFRGGTTFDNRQWMDIRGVGSGATGIEYVERGTHLERNVTFHEYVHLFHGAVFTDQEMRAVRKRYYEAMDQGRTLDYYSANNEFEYLAQTLPAYFIPVKVHPLNHKSVNTRSDLQARDPQMYAFLDSLVRKNQRYLAGDDSAMADNWAQVYVSLARWKYNPDQARALLDTALQWAPAYLPAYLAYAKAMGRLGQWDSAQQWLERALVIDSAYAPIWVTKSQLTSAAFDAGEISATEALQRHGRWLALAYDLEDDWDQQAWIADRWYHLYDDFGLWHEAIEVAESYAFQAPEVSTYLRDRKFRAQSFALSLKGRCGYQEMVRDSFEHWMRQRPQNEGLRVAWGEAL
ncbi:MAG: tetratricopeptide repeat protein, partial [Bacteroidota bacterium]